MSIRTENPNTAERPSSSTELFRASDFLLLVEPVWVIVAASLTYLSVISDWASFVSWSCTSLAFAPFPLRLIRHGHLSRFTPFDIPIAVLLIGMIVGIIVSDFLDISLGAFQTFLVSIAFYYSVVNYSKPTLIIKTGLVIAAIVSIIVLAIAVKWELADINIPHGLDITLVIIAFIVLVTIISSKRKIYQVFGILVGLMFTGMIIFLTHYSLYRVTTLASVEGRMYTWLKVITPIGDSTFWTGIGLGNWPLITGITTEGHVHNAYLELFINNGFLGLVALTCFLAVGNKLTIDIIYSPKSNLYYGFGIGVILASLAILLVSFLESAPFGFGFLHGGSYHYIVSPIPFILAGVLVIVHRLLKV